MDVKDPTKVKNDSSAVAQTQSKSPARSDATLTVASVLSVSADAVKVQLERGGSSAKNSALRLRINQAINAVHEVIERTSDLEKLVRSIDGIVAQANKTDIPQRRVAVLQKEAGELAGKVVEITEALAEDRLRPALDEDIRGEIERRLGRTLDSIFPDQMRAGFGLSNISLSPKENIINTIAHVAEARRRIEQLNDSVRETRDAVQSVVSALEVAVQNSEASEASVRDVERAAALASETKISIARNPDGALRSVGILSDGALKLLK